MPHWLAVVVLGLIEGVTEFLPVSSTGHLLLAESIGGLPPQSDLFNILIQSGTCVAVAVAFAGRLSDLLSHLGEAPVRAYLAKLVAAVALTVVGLLVAKRLGFTLPKNPEPVAWATLVGGFAILGIERGLRGRRLADEITWTIAVGVGLAQIVAGIFPGTSRAGATILVALAIGANRPRATEFSFLVGIPTLLGAGAYEAARAMRQSGPVPTDWATVALGTIVAAVAALLVVRWLLRFVQTHTFVGFGWYRIALGLAILIFPHRSV